MVCRKILANGAVSGLNSTATRFTPGANPLSSSSHLPPSDASKLVKPVMLPPGRARFSTKPTPSGSATCRNTTGIVRRRPGAPRRRRASRAPGSRRGSRPRALSPPPRCGRNRSPASDIRAADCGPAVHPRSCSPCWKAATSASPSASPAARPVSTATRRIRSPCARAREAAMRPPPPSAVTNSRRPMRGHSITSSAPATIRIVVRSPWPNNLHRAPKIFFWHH